MKKLLIVLLFNVMLSGLNAQTIDPKNNGNLLNSDTISDYLSNISSEQLKSALRLDFQTKTSLELIDKLVTIWQTSFSDSNTDLEQVVSKLYDNMKNVLSGISFDIKTEKIGTGQIVIKTYINYPYQQGFKKLNIDYYMKKDGILWKVDDLKIGGLDVLPLYEITHKKN